MIAADVRVAVAARAEVGEGPFVDPRTGRLGWVDIVRGELHDSDPSTGATRTQRYNTMLGAVVPRRGSGYAAAVTAGFGVIDADLTICDAMLPAGWRMNDGKCDARGRLWAGSTEMGFATDAGRLHVWDGRGPSRVALENLTLPNGLAWSPDNRTMYVVDSVVRHVLRAEFDVDAGELGEPEVLIAFDGTMPDGMCADVEGALWIALWGGGRVVRVSPAGEVVDELLVPVSQPSSCAFGPAGELYITTARSGLNDAALERQPLAGSVLVARTETRGLPVHAFAA